MLQKNGRMKRKYWLKAVLNLNSAAHIEVHSYSDRALEAKQLAEKLGQIVL